MRCRCSFHVEEVRCIILFEVKKISYETPEFTPQYMASRKLYKPSPTKAQVSGNVSIRHKFLLKNCMLNIFAFLSVIIFYRIHPNSKNFVKVNNSMPYYSRPVITEC